MIPQTPIRLLVALFCLFTLIACGGHSPDLTTTADSGGSDDDKEAPNNQSPECFDPTEARFPASPEAGQSRNGFSCSIKLKAKDLPNIEEIPGFESFDDESFISFQILEPSTVVGGDKYPLILEGHGFSGSRSTSGSSTGLAGLTVPTQPMLDGGFGILSIDQAGHGETTGLIRVMDPDQEGKFLLAILDWAEANLDWLAYGPEGGFTPGNNETEGSFTPNPLIGAIGPSYGGGYQMLIHSIDPKRRLDTIVPQITWNDLSYSIFPGDVPKSFWGAVLFAAGNSAGTGTDIGHFDPFVQRAFTEALSAGRVSDEALDYFQYHGMGYFCDEGNTPLRTNTNGDNGTATAAGDTQYNIDFQPTKPNKIHAIFWQGMRDQLFNFNEAYQNYKCLQPLGGDVRLLSYQSGHNTLQVPADPMQGTHPQNATIGTCGPFDPTFSSLEFFKRYLKRDDETAGTGVHADIDSMLPDGEEVCMSLQGSDNKDQAGDNGDRYKANDYVLVHKDALPVGEINGVEIDNFIATTVAGVTANSAATVTEIPFDINQYDVLAGIPELHVTIKSACITDVAPFGPEDACSTTPDPTAVVLFMATVTSDDQGATWQVADNQVTPFRGLSDDVIEIELPGIGERLIDGTKVGISIFGVSDQYPSQGSSNPGSFATLPITVEGKAYIPFLKESDL